MTFGKKSFSAEQASGSVSIASKWSHAIDVGTNLEDVLADFRKLVGASNVQVVRIMRTLERTRTIARFDESAGKIFARAPRSFVSVLLGDLAHKTNLGGLFLMRDMSSSVEARANLDEWGLRDACIVSLCHNQEFSDFLEFQFERPLLDHNSQLLEMLGSVLSRSWCERAIGSIAKRLAGNPFPIANDHETKFANILSSANPYDLTRSEFRVCMLIQEGVLPDDLAIILQICKSTLRSHMRAIYFKTHVSGHVALVHHLHRTGNEISGARHISG